MTLLRFITRLVKRDGKRLTYEDLELWIQKLLNGEISDAQLGAWLMAVYIQGLNYEETANLTIIMTHSGSVSGGASGAQASLNFLKGTTCTTLTEPLWRHY